MSPLIINLLVSSSDSFQVQTKIHIHSRKGARQALSFARAVRASLKADEDSASMHIDEIEEYLGILREEKASIESQVAEAEEQIGMVREMLDSNGIPEVSLSDDEDASTTSIPPASSDFMCLDSELEVSGSMPYVHLGRPGTPDSGSSSLSNSPRTRRVGAI
jgi:hypothetical protein